MTMLDYIDRLDFLTEHVMAEYELSLFLNESGDTNTAIQKITPQYTASNKLVKIIRKIWDVIKSICRWIAKILVNVFRIIKDGHYTAEKEFKYSKVLLKRPLMINSLTEKNAERIAFALENNYSNEINTEVTIKVNQKIPVSLIQNCDAWVKINKNIEPVVNNIQKITNLVVLKNIEYVGSVISRIMTAAQDFLKQFPIRAKKHGKDDYYEMGKIESGELIGANGKKLADTEFYTKKRVATSRSTRLKEKNWN